jgi:predicted dehydrogenase
MSSRAVRVGIVGAGYIAGVHSAAYRAAAGTYAGDAASLELAAVADPDRERAQALSRAWGWQRVEADWPAITRDDRIDLVDICVPNALHAEIAVDALRHGKHVLCEKPLARNVAEARAMTAAAATAATLSQVCFYYRLWPAVALAADAIHDGRIGTVSHFRGWMLQDYAADPTHGLGWRASRRDAGAGALADLGSHIIDIARHLCGEIEQVHAVMSTLVDRGAEADRIDDHAALLVEFSSGASGVIEASWAMRGHKCDLGFDVVGDRGAIRFSWERANELEVLVDDPAEPLSGFRRVLIGGGPSDAGRFVAVPGQGLGYRDAFTIGIGHLLSAIAASAERTRPSFEDGLRASLVVDAALRADASRQWVQLDVPGEIQ